jgi:hypothetical protein
MVVIEMSWIISDLDETNRKLARRAIKPKRLAPKAIKSTKLVVQVITSYEVAQRRYISMCKESRAFDKLAILIAWTFMSALLALFVNWLRLLNTQGNRVYLTCMRCLYVVSWIGSGVLFSLSFYQWPSTTAVILCLVSVSNSFEVRPIAVVLIAALVAIRSELPYLKIEKTVVVVLKQKPLTRLAASQLPCSHTYQPNGMADSIGTLILAIVVVSLLSWLGAWFRSLREAQNQVYLLVMRCIQLILLLFILTGFVLSVWSK